MTRRARAGGDDLLVRRAARRIAIQAAAVVALAIVVLVTLATAVVVHGQSAAIDSLLRSTASTADDVIDPPPGAWLVLERSGRVEISAGLPTPLLPRLTALRAQADSTTHVSDLPAAGSTSYRVATLARTGTVVQVVLDLTPDREQRFRLFTAMGVAAGVGFLFAPLLGLLIGRRAVRPLADALGLQRNFVANASHELRTPLTLLSTRAQVLDRSLRAHETGVLTPQILTDSAGVLDDVTRLADVVDDLLLAADPGGEQSWVPTDLTEVVGTVLDSAHAHAQAAEVVLVSPSPAAANAVWVRASVSALRRAVLTLVENAIDHTPPGGEVTVAIEHRARAVVVSVSDTGPGIPAGTAPHLFERFHSGGQRAGRTHYGLGLALTHDIAHRLGGTLRLVASPLGATFELSLPTLGDPA